MKGGITCSAIGAGWFWVGIKGDERRYKVQEVEGGKIAVHTRVGQSREWLFSFEYDDLDSFFEYVLKALAEEVCCG